jgi:hypothetical protein
MKSLTASKIESQLLQEEGALRDRLLTALPVAAQSGQDLFTNSRFNPHGLLLSHVLPLSEQLLASADKCIALRRSIGLAVEGSVGQLFVAACEERANSEPHGRGPKKLAAWLLAELPNERSGR